MAELRAREMRRPQRIRPVRRPLGNHRNGLPAFARQLDQDSGALAEAFRVPAAVVEEVRQAPSLAAGRPERWRREEAPWQRRGSRYGAPRAAVAELLERVVRAGGAIENLNGRSRTHFFPRRRLGEDYPTPLRFFLNHRRFVRSEHPERVGKSPAELLTGQSQPHRPEWLGYTPFSRN